MVKQIIGEEPTLMASATRLIVVVGALLGLSISPEIAVAIYIVAEAATAVWNRSKVSPVEAPPLPYEHVAPVVELASRRPPPPDAA